MRFKAGCRVIRILLRGKKVKLIENRLWRACRRFLPLPLHARTRHRDCPDAAALERGQPVCCSLCIKDIKKRSFLAGRIEFFETRGSARIRNDSDCVRCFRQRAFEGGRIVGATLEMNVF